MQILFPLCVPQTGLPCLPPTNPNCHHESRKKHTLSLENNTNWLTYFFHTKQHDFKMLKKARAKVNSLSAPPPPLTPHAHELLNLGNQTREREKKRKRKKKPSLPLLHIVYISSSLHKHKVHRQKCLGQSLYSARIRTFVYQGNKPVLWRSRCKAIMKRHICILPHLGWTVCGTSCTVRAAGIYLQREALKHRRSAGRLGKAQPL